MKNEILIYDSNELMERIEVRLDQHTVWLNRQQIALLLGRDLKPLENILIMFLQKRSSTKKQLSQILI